MTSTGPTFFFARNLKPLGQVAFKRHTQVGTSLSMTEQGKGDLKQYCQVPTVKTDRMDLTLKHVYHLQCL